MRYCNWPRPWGSKALKDPRQCDGETNKISAQANSELQTVFPLATTRQRLLAQLPHVKLGSIKPSEDRTLQSIIAAPIITNCNPDLATGYNRQECQYGASIAQASRTRTAECVTQAGRISCAVRRIAIGRQRASWSIEVDSAVRTLFHFDQTHGLCSPELFYFFN